MTPLQFKNIREGDLLRNANGHGYIVVQATGGDSIIVQHLLTIPITHAERWKINGRIMPCTQVPTPHPPNFIMHADLINAGFLYLEQKDGKKYQNNGALYDTVEAAWDSLQNGSHKVSDAKQQFRAALNYPTTVTELHDQLEKGGWKRDCQGPTWTGPSGQRVTGAREAWRCMKGLD